MLHSDTKDFQKVANSVCEHLSDGCESECAYEQGRASIRFRLTFLYVSGFFYFCADQTELMPSPDVWNAVV